MASGCRAAGHRRANRYVASLLSRCHAPLGRSITGLECLEPAGAKAQDDLIKALKAPCEQRSRGPGSPGFGEVQSTAQLAQLAHLGTLLFLQALQIQISDVLPETQRKVCMLFAILKRGLTSDLRVKRRRFQVPIPSDGDVCLKACEGSCPVEVSRPEPL
ncbi:unnamed protein product [Boreogadus saida]